MSTLSDRSEPSAFRVNVLVGGETYLVVVDDPLTTVARLGEMAIAALVEHRGVEWAANQQADGKLGVTHVRRQTGDSVVGKAELVIRVLNDGDTVTAVLDGEASRRARLTSDVPNVRKETMAGLDPLDFNVLMTLGRHEEDVELPTSFEKSVELNGSSLTPATLIKIAQGKYKVLLANVAKQRVTRSRKMLDEIVAENKVVYGVTTGFGNFASVCIAQDKLVELQQNLIRSHCCGTGAALTIPRTRALLALRINVLAKGYAGISLPNLVRMVDALNASCVSYVPQQGTVGCSGDLAPLAHLALGLMGEGRMWSPTTGWADAKHVLAENGLVALELGPKEGLAMINGTQMVTSLGAEAVERASAIARQADVVAALTLDVLKGSCRSYDADIHRLRGHRGQIAVAERMRALLHSEAHPSEIAESHRFCNKVQDAYTLRCVPQVHGIVHDTVAFVRGIIGTELNAATDNPLVFADRGEIISGGNFHGEYPAKALDYLAIGIHELAQISERRLERLMNPHLSGLPAFLTKDGGLNSGYMMVQVTAAGLVSENKVLCHPSSVDSIPTSCNQEDHVSMGGFAARKCLDVIGHVEKVLGMELLAACSGMDLLAPLKSTAPLDLVYRMVRKHIPALERDRYMAADMATATALLRQQEVWACVAPYLAAAMELPADETSHPPRIHSPTAYVRGEEDNMDVHAH